MSTLRLEFLGSLTVALDETPVSGFLSNKVRALLVYLVVTARPQAREYLATLLWGDMSDADAKSNLRQALANLKKLLDPYFEITRDTVEFRRDAAYFLDVEAFGKIGDWKPEPRDSFQASISGLQSLVALYHGEFLAGFYVRDAPEFEEWVLTQRARWHDLAVVAHETLMRELAARGQYAVAITYAKQLLTLEPWREEAHRQLMLLYARTGQRSAALAQYETCRNILRAEMGVEPFAETRVWYERLRAADAAPRFNLPLQTTLFVGRETELAQLENLLLNPNARLITLTGVGGVGKTRLALQAAARVRDLGAFLDGVVFVSLAELAASDLIAPALSQALGLPLSAAAPLAQITDYLRAKELLVVLDNFENVIADTRWLVDLMTHAPRVKFLVASREKLNLRAEWPMPLDGVAYPRATAAANIAAFDAVRLFVERAQQASPAFTLDASNALPIARVCELTQGLPLGIELAAAWVSQYSCQELARELERGYDILATNLRDVPTRQTSLRAVFEYSWQRLSERERAVWRKLAVFHGGWTRDAARAIADASPQDLNALADKSLARVDAASRYGMHQLAHQFAREKLEQDAAENAVARAKHSEFFAAFAAAHEGALKGAGDQVALNALTQELANVLAGWAAAWSELAWKSIRAYMEPLFVILEMRGEFSLGAQLYADARGCVEALPKRSSEAKHVLGQLLIREGWMRFRLGEFPKTLELVERGLPFLEKARDEYEIAYALLFLGAAEWGRGELAASEKFFQASYELYEKIESAWGCAGALNNLGQLAHEKGDYAAATEYLQRGLVFARAANISHQTAHLLNNLAMLAVRRENFQAAQKFLGEALDIAKASGEPHIGAITQVHLAQVYAHDDPARAYEIAQAALSQLDKFGDRSNMLHLLILLGKLARVQHEISRAENYLRQAASLAREIGAPAQTLDEISHSLETLPPS